MVDYTMYKEIIRIKKDNAVIVLSKIGSLLKVITDNGLEFKK